MDLSKAFDTVNRTILWTALYKTGIPIQTILHIRRGHANTTLQSKYNKQYGKKIYNNIGVAQGSAVSALLFIIYLQDMMDDFHALNYLRKIPYSETNQRDEQTETNTLLAK